MRFLLGIVAFVLFLSAAPRVAAEGMCSLLRNAPIDVHLGCELEFAAIACMAAPSVIDKSHRLAPPLPSLLSPREAGAIKFDIEFLDQSLRSDIELLAASHMSGNSLAGSLSDETVTAANEIAQSLGRHLEKLGFKIDHRRAPEYTRSKEEGGYKIPDHNFLAISRGNAMGPLARELDRYETYLRERLADPELPEAIRKKSFPLRIDPLLARVLNMKGAFSHYEAAGTGMSVAPEMFVASQSALIEIIRHEMRHMKVYFDLVSGKPTIYRARISDIADTGAPGNYRNTFFIDEIEGFKANLRNSQQKLGKETEAVRKKLSTDGPAESRSTIGNFEKSVEELKAEARTYARFINSFVKSSLETGALARRIIADPALSTSRLAERILLFETESMPEVSTVIINLAENQKAKGRSFILSIPTTTVKKGTEAIRDYAMNYLVDLEAHVLEEQRELAVRLRDVERSAAERLAPSSPSLNSPATN